MTPRHDVTAGAGRSIRGPGLAGAGEAEGDGEGAFAHARRVLAVCGGGVEVDGLQYSDNQELAAPTLGDEAVARRISVEQTATQEVIGVDVPYARAGDTIVVSSSPSASPTSWSRRRRSPSTERSPRSPANMA